MQRKAPLASAATNCLMTASRKRSLNLSPVFACLSSQNLQEHLLFENFTSLSNLFGTEQDQKLIRKDREIHVHTHRERKKGLSS